MKSLLLSVISNNIISIGSIFLLLYALAPEPLPHWKDLVFYNLILHWGIGAFSYLFSPQIGLYSSDDPEVIKTITLVDQTASVLLDKMRFMDNLSFCFRLFISGLPSLFILFSV
ncbi:hypothetical protein [Vibrio coralliirubri]|uniref:hypothetical protein n=1 Tax=Vibrio coralliirubri TaxID=1516159 RepID=UPI00073EA449|nr:hypothetical protein [Vibrio coralliirubri]